LGTLIAVLVFLKRDISELFRTQRKKLLMLSAALIPLIPSYFLLKPVRDFAAQPHYLGFCLLATSLILFLGGKVRVRRENCTSMKRQISDALWIGTLQSTALIPGISRSASTISCARILGWDGARAVRFSFLLSIPTIVGGNCLELLKMAHSSTQTPPLSPCIIGLIASCTVGLNLIGRAIAYLEKGKLKPFAWYCLILGLTSTVFLR
jgi:undecaprenyl-diphosphatase